MSAAIMTTETVNNTSSNDDKIVIDIPITNNTCDIKMADAKHMSIGGSLNDTDTVMEDTDNNVVTDSSPPSSATPSPTMSSTDNTIYMFDFVEGDDITTNTIITNVTKMYANTYRRRELEAAIQTAFGRTFTFTDDFADLYDDNRPNRTKARQSLDEYVKSKLPVKFDAHALFAKIAAECEANGVDLTREMVLSAFAEAKDTNVEKKDRKFSAKTKASDIWGRVIRERFTTYGKAVNQIKHLVIALVGESDDLINELSEINDSLSESERARGGRSFTEDEFKVSAAVAAVRKGIDDYVTNYGEEKFKHLLDLTVNVMPFLTEHENPDAKKYKVTMPLIVSTLVEQGKVPTELDDAAKKLLIDTRTELVAKAKATREAATAAREAARKRQRTD